MAPLYPVFITYREIGNNTPSLDDGQEWKGVEHANSIITSFLYIYITQQLHWVMIEVEGSIELLIVKCQVP